MTSETNNQYRPTVSVQQLPVMEEQESQLKEFDRQMMIALSQPEGGCAGWDPLYARQIKELKQELEYSNIHTEVSNIYTQVIDHTASEAFDIINYISHASNEEILDYLSRKGPKFYTKYFSDKERAKELVKALEMPFKNLAMKKDLKIVKKLVPIMEHLDFGHSTILELMRLTLETEPFDDVGCVATIWNTTDRQAVIDNREYWSAANIRQVEVYRAEHERTQEALLDERIAVWTSCAGKHLPPQMKKDFQAMNKLAKSYRSDVFIKYFKLLDKIYTEDGKVTEAWSDLSANINGRNASFVGKLFLLDVYGFNTPDEQVLEAFKNIDGTHGNKSLTLFRRLEDFNNLGGSSDRKQQLLRLAAPNALRPEDVRELFEACKKDPSIKKILEEQYIQSEAELFLEEFESLIDNVFKKQDIMPERLKKEGKERKEYIRYLASKKRVYKKCKKLGITIEPAQVAFKQFQKIMEERLDDPKFSSSLLGNLESIVSCLALGTEQHQRELLAIGVDDPDKTQQMNELRQQALTERLPCLESPEKFEKYKNVFLANKRYPTAVPTYLKGLTQITDDQDQFDTIHCLNTFVNNALEGSKDYRYGHLNSRPSRHLDLIFDQAPLGGLLEREWRNGREMEIDIQGKAYSLVDSDDFMDLFLMGTEGGASCFHLDRPANDNKCLQGYMVDGKNRLIAIKDENGKIVARAGVRILWDKQNKRQAIFLEKVHVKGELNDELKAEMDKILRKFAIQKARVLRDESGIDLHLYEVSSTTVEACGITLESLDSPAPYEKADSVVGLGKEVIVKNGVFEYDQVKEIPLN